LAEQAPVALALALLVWLARVLGSVPALALEQAPVQTIIQKAKKH